MDTCLGAVRHIPKQKEGIKICDITYHYYVLLIDNNSTRQEQRICGDTSDRPRDVFPPDYPAGKPTYFDLAVVNPLMSGIINCDSVTPSQWVCTEMGERGGRVGRMTSIKQAWGWYVMSLFPGLSKHWITDPIGTTMFI